MSTFVFLGPSLGLDAARDIVDARFLPPARMGDIYRLCEQRPRAIGLIDGLFERTPAVWHKEILYAMSLGIRVYGGSSMGALRAAELRSFGMQGVGCIFAGYASGELEADDEVALVHGPVESGFASQSEALVNIRYALDDAVAQGVLGTETAHRCLALAVAEFYPERSWPRLFALARLAGIAPVELQALQAWVEQRRPNQKRDDALATLRQIAADNAAGASAAVPAWTFEPTSAWESLRAANCSVGGGGEGDAVRFDLMRNHARLFSHVRMPVQRLGLLLELAEAEAARQQLAVPARAALLTKFFEQRGAGDAEARGAWCQANDVDEEGALQLARLDYLLGELGRRMRVRIEGQLLGAMKLEGAYAATRAHVEQKWLTLQEHDFQSYTQADIAPLAEVLDWHRRQHGAPPAGANLLGFETEREYINELNAEYFYAHENAPADDATRSTF